ncbi:MAG: hypothetical protein IH840_11315, partial [Candidatus Heimdallarchaeota archaeon]|nr:hypothetical protein [Candidatus Heimdallarchaeota archaeon]
VKHKVIKIDPEDIAERSQFFLSVAKNPALLVNTTEKKEIKKEKPAKKKVKAKKKTTKKKVAKKEKSAKKKGKVKKAKKASTKQLTNIPSAPVTTGDRGVDPFQRLADQEDTGPIVDDFQIAYFEASGGKKFIVMQEFDNVLKGDTDFKMLEAHIALINDLLNDKTSHKDAKAVLTKSINNIVENLFSEPVKKAPKKKPIKAKKPTKSTKVATSKNKAAAKSKKKKSKKATKAKK